MASRNIITIAKGVTRDDFDWGYLLQGSRESLIATGLAENSWFPDGVVLNKCGKVVRTRHSEIAGRKVTVRQERKKFYVYVNLNENEKPANQIRNLPPTQPLDAAKMAKANMDIFVVAARAAFNLENGPNHPWRFALEVQTQAARLCSEMVALFRQSAIESHKPARALTHANARGERFMLQLVSSQ